MYLSHFQLDQKPFQISADPKFLWLGEKHREALAVLKYGVLDNRGFLLLTGDVGTGKTTLINELINSLEKDITAAVVPDPGLPNNEFFNYIARSFGLGANFKSKGPFLLAFEDFLDRQHAKGKTTLLVIDEAQRLNQHLLEEIRLLSNIEKPDTKLLNVFFVGQDEFNEMLLDKRNRAIRQRITINYHIDPLTQDEVSEYIGHRLRVAGAPQNPFSDEAVDVVWSLSEGYPRLINILCDQALLTAFVMREKIVSEDFVRECAEELKIRPVEVPDETQEPTAAPAPAPSPPAAAQESRITAREPLPPDPERPGETGRRPYRPVMVGLLILVVFVFSGYLALSAMQKLPLLYNSVGSDLSSEKKSGEQYAESENGPETSDRENVSLDADSRKGPVRAAALPSEGHLLESGGVPDKLMVHFDHDSYELSSSALETLDRVEDIVKAYPSTTIDLVGYSDSTGHPRYNLWVSEFRANIVKSYLAGKGLSSERIKISALGSRDPIAPNSTQEGRQMNRRVEIKFTQGPAADQQS